MAGKSNVVSIDKAKKKRTKPKAPKVLQIKITLKESKPPIWRRVLIPGDMTLHELHDIIQTCMGWTDTHLHEFEAGGKRYALPHPEEWVEAIDESKVTVGSLLRKPKDKILYIYDFGDYWRHEVLLEKTLALGKAPKNLPVCLKGVRACPPEDCGGIWGYYDLLEAINDPNHPEHSEYREWIGEFDPIAFDLKEINELLKKMR